MTNKKAQCAQLDRNNLIEELRAVLEDIRDDVDFRHFAGVSSESAKIASWSIENLDGEEAEEDQLSLSVICQWVIMAQTWKIEVMTDVIRLMLEKQRHTEGVQRIKDSFSD
jgi:hypothetical protein